MHKSHDAKKVLPTNLSIRLRGTPGTAPGRLIIDPNAPATTVSIVEYDSVQLEEYPCEDVQALAGKLPGAAGVLWVNAVGLGDQDTLQALAAVFDIHRLALEDMVNVHQRPKCEAYGERLFVVTRMSHGSAEGATEQVSLFLGPGFLLTVQERPGDCLDPVRKRIREANGRIRHRGPDYLMYAVLDAITDAWFPVLEGLGERLEDLESEALDRPTLQTLARIRGIRRELMAVRRTVWPQRELFSALLRDDVPGVTDSTRVYLRDCYDHSVQLLDITDNYRELSSGLMDVYLSSTGNRMNEIMKVLTIVATIFIPLTFIAGIYGMNFDSAKSPWNMPELSWYLGYPLSLLAMLVVGLGMLLYFKRLGWIFTSRTGS